MYTLGIDIGSTTSKCAVLKDGKELVATSLRVGGMGTEGPQEALDDLWADSGLRREEMAHTIVTGYGRKNYEGADGEVSELTCHAMGGRFVFPGLRTVIDIGGQDAKIISLTEDGRMANFVMNDKCAAGTGRFLDVMAGVLDVKTEELGELSSQARSEVSISNTCTVFAESEVISQLSNNVPLPDLVAGIHASLAKRVAALVFRNGLVKDVAMSGGVALNSGVVRALSRELKSEILVHEDCQLAGAIGAAILAYREAKRVS